MTTNPSVSIIVPARNERPYIASIVSQLPLFPGPCELIFVEGHSQDGTLAEIKKVASQYADRKMVRYFIQAGKGKADAVWRGLAEAHHDLLMIYDADLTVPPEELPAFYQAACTGPATFVNGTRLVYPMERGAMRFFNYLGNKIFAWLIGLITRQSLTDTLCGTKVLQRRQFEKMRTLPWLWQGSDPFGDFTLLAGAAALGLKIVEVPVHYRARRYGGTKIRRFRDGWKLLRIAWRFRRAAKHADPIQQLA